MPYTPFGDKSPWESLATRNQRVREEEQEKEKLRKIEQMLDESKRRGNFFESNEVQNLRKEIQDRQENLNKTYRGIASGITGVFQQNDLGLKRLEPIQDQAEDDGINLNPFSYIGQGLMKGLEGWQKATEFTAGVVASPFSQQVKRNMDRGMSPGEAWRRSKFATTRIGADPEKGEEGFGFNLGVKGAVEMLVDPVGLATMALPVGAISKTVGKGVSSVLSKVPGIRGVRKEGQEILKRGIDLDAQIKGNGTYLEKIAEYKKSLADGEFSKSTFYRKQKALRDKFADQLNLKGVNRKELVEILEKGELVKHKTGRIQKLDEVANNLNVNFDVFDVSNYDAMLESRGINNEGLIADFLRYANSDKAKNSSFLKGRLFFQGLRNIHKLYNPAFSYGSTLEGRAALAYAYDISKADSHITNAMSGFVVTENPFKIQDVTEEVIKDDLTYQQNYKLIKARLKRERVVAPRTQALESEVRGGPKRILEGEVRLSNVSDDGAFTVYDVNGAGRFQIRFKNGTTQFWRDALDRTAPGADKAALKQQLAAGDSLLSNYSQKMGKKYKEVFKENYDPNNIGLQPGNGTKLKIADIDIVPIETYTINVTGKGKNIADTFAAYGIRKKVKELATKENEIILKKKSKDRTGLRSLNAERKALVADINESFSRFYDQAMVDDKNFKNFEVKKVTPTGGAMDVVDAPTMTDAKNKIFASKQRVPAGTTRVGGRYRGSITDAATASSYLNLVEDGLKKSRLVVETVSDKKVAKLSDNFGDDLDSVAGIYRNLKRTLDDAMDDPSSPLYGQGRKFDAIRYTDDTGKERLNHFGNFFATGTDEYPERLADWKNLKKMGVLPEDQIAKLEQKYPDLAKTGNVGDVSMNFVDFLDLGGYVIDYNGPAGRPVRLFEEFFDLDADQITWLSNYYRMFDEGAALLRMKNIPANNLFANQTGNYIRHLVDEYAIIDELVEAQTKSYLTGAPLGKQPYRRPRIFDNILDGIEERGYGYQQDPLVILEDFLKGVYKEVGEANYIRRLETIAGKQLNGLSVDTQLKIKKFKIDQDELKSIIGKINKLDTAPVLFAQLGDDFIEQMDRIVKEDGLEMYARGQSWSEVKERASKQFQTGTEDAKAKAVEILQDFTEKMNSGYQDDLANLQKKISDFTDNYDVKTIDKERKLSGLFTEQAVIARAVRDQRNSFSKQVKALQDRNLFFREDTAKQIEKTLNINAENSFDNFVKSTSKINDVVRIVQTGFDAGTAFLHGLPTLMRGIAAAPGKVVTGEENLFLKSWAEATTTMFKYIINGSDSRRMHAQLIYNKKENFQLMSKYGVLISSAGQDYFRARNTAGGGLRKIMKEGRVNNRQELNSLPGHAKIKKGLEKGESVLDGFQTSFEAYGDIIREGLWQAHYKQILNGRNEAGRLLSEVAPDIIEQQLVQLGEHINNMTGAFSSRRAGISARQQNVERSVLFFSPSYTRATLGLIGSVVKGDLQGDQARAAIRSMMGAGVATHLAMASLNATIRGESIEKHIKLDPTKGDFLTTKVGDVDIGFGSAWMSMARLFGKLAADPAFRGDILDSPLLLTGSGRGRPGFDENGIKDFIANNQLLYWLRSRSAPAGSTMWDIAMGANFLGESIQGAEWFTGLASNALPFWAESVLENGIISPTALISGAGDFVGMRANPVSEWEKRAEVRDGLAQQYFGKGWRFLNDVDRRFIETSSDIEADPNVQRLRELTDNIREERRAVGGSQLDRLIDERYYKIEDARNLYLEKTKQAEALMRDGTYSVEQYIAVEQKYRSNYGNTIEYLDNSEEYKQVKSYYDALAQESAMGTNERIEDYAADEYAELYFDPKYDMEFMYDFPAREEALDEWRQKYSNPEFEKYAIQKLFGARWEATGMNMEFYKHRAELMPIYWEETRKEIFERRYRGSFNDAYQRWYRAKYDDLEQKRIVDDTPGLKQALKEWEQLREATRRNNAQLDAFLYRFGYSETLLHPFNVGREEELKSTFPMDRYVPPWKVAGE